MKTFNVRYRFFKGAEPVSKVITARGKIDAFRQIEKSEGIDFELVVRIDEIK